VAADATAAVAMTVNGSAVTLDVAPRTTLSDVLRDRLGLTGTPFRADNLAFCSARRQRVREGDSWVEQIVPDLSVEPRQLILAGEVRPLEFRFQDGWVDHGRQAELVDGEAVPVGEVERSPLSQEQRESWRARNLRRAIQLGDSSSIALRLLLSARRRLEGVRRQHNGAGGLVIARNIAHARRVCGLLEEQGDRVLLVHSQDPEAPARMQAFKAGEADWLVSIDMCAEGFDAGRKDARFCGNRLNLRGRGSPSAAGAARATGSARSTTRSTTRSARSYRRTAACHLGAAMRVLAAVERCVRNAADDQNGHRCSTCDDLAFAQRHETFDSAVTLHFHCPCGHPAGRRKDGFSYSSRTRLRLWPADAARQKLMTFPR
jgi:hypothetical protein